MTNGPSWLPPKNSDVYRAFRSLEIDSLMHEYDHQRQILEGLQGDLESSIFIASFQATEDRIDNPQYTYCGVVRGDPQPVAKGRIHRLRNGKYSSIRSTAATRFMGLRGTNRW